MAILDIFNKKTGVEKSPTPARKTAKEAEVVSAERVEKKTEEKIQTKTKELKNGVAFYIKPLVTEKAFVGQGKGVYFFKVKNNVNRVMVKNHIRAVYKVTPLKVNILNTADKSMIFRRRRNIKPGYKKAMVYLKEGETISPEKI